MVILIIPYQAITGNNNVRKIKSAVLAIIPYQAITGNNNYFHIGGCLWKIIPYQAITGNNNCRSASVGVVKLYHTKR